MSLLRLPFDASPVPVTLQDHLERFRWRERPTRVSEVSVALSTQRSVSLPVFVNEFWTARQRAAHSLHELSYRACFKPQVPRFFVERLTRPGDVVYDPFSGRGTTVLESALLGRVPAGCDVNPLSAVLAAPRLDPPGLDELARAVADLDLSWPRDIAEDLLAFFHRETLGEICALREHLCRRAHAGALTRAEAWIRMVALNRLTGHSPGFFSVYTMPPNQAVSIAAQRKINALRNQEPPRRDVRALILAKSRALLRDGDAGTRGVLAAVRPAAHLLTADAASTPAIPSDSVTLVVTSPPFLDVVDYRTDNWLRCWFCGIDAEAVPVTTPRRLDAWQAFVTGVLRELRRVLVPGGHVAFEVGEVRGGTVRLEETVVRAAVDAGLAPVLVLINDQRFTKTANCWGVDNNRKGTNSNRVVVLRKA